MREKERRGTRLGFWNIAGMKNKGEDVWKYLESFDILGLTKTWIDEKDWEKMRKKLPFKQRWECIPATKEKKKRRTKSGIMIQINKRLEFRTTKEWNKQVIEVEVIFNEKKWLGES